MWDRVEVHPDRANGLEGLGPPFERPAEETDFYDGSTDRRRQEFREDSRFLTERKPGITNGVTYEIARFETSFAESGFVKGCWTWLETQAMPLPFQGTIYQPFAWENEGVEVRWYLRLSQQAEPYGPYWQGDWQALPGWAFPESNQWDEVRYLWGTPEGSVWWLIPRGNALRLFVRIITSDDSQPRQHIVRVGGRLWGYVQPATCKAAVVNGIHGWQS